MPDKSQQFFTALGGSFKKTGEACTKPINQPDPGWQPKIARRRVEIMVTGEPERVDIVRESINKIQEELFGKTVKPGDLEMRVSAMLDDCVHRTAWSTSPKDVGNGTTRWHCHQKQTSFTKALAFSADEANIDAILIFGNRFDDKLEETLAQVDKLEAQGTKIYALHVDDITMTPEENEKIRAAYETLAERTGGVCLQLTDQRALHTVLPILTDYLMRGDKALAALALPNDPDVKLLVDRLSPKPADKKL